MSERLEVNAPAPSAPDPEAPTKREATNVTVVRDVDSESARPRLSVSASSKMKAKTVPKALSKPAPVTGSSVNDARLVVSSAPLVPIERPDLNWFIPSFAFMFRVIAMMNDKITELRNFGDRGTIQTWSPFTTIIYFSILAYIQVLRAQEIAGLISSDQLLFLQQFLSLYRLDSLVIPGPLVHFFRSLSVCSPGISTYQDVLPAIPELRFQENYFYGIESLRPHISDYTHASGFLLPHVRLVLDQYFSMLNQILTATDIADRAYSRFTLYATVFGQKFEDLKSSGINNAEGRLFSLVNNCAFASRPNASDGLMSRHANYMVNFASLFPPSWKIDLDNRQDHPSQGDPATYASFSMLREFLGLDEHMQWFGVIVSGMQEFCSHWNGNVTLQSLIPVTSTASLILYNGLSLVPRPARPAFGSAPKSKSTKEFNFNVTAVTTNPYVTTEDYEDSRIALINTIGDTSTLLHTGEVAGELDITRFGSFWSVSPAQSRSNTLDLTLPLLNSFSSVSYFNARGNV